MVEVLGVTLESEYLIFILEKVKVLYINSYYYPQLHIDMVKDYFGEKIGLYFLWTAHYTTWLFSSALFGLACWINVAYDNNNPDAPAMPYYATFVCIWSTLFLGIIYLGFE